MECCVRYKRLPWNGVSLSKCGGLQTILQHIFKLKSLARMTSKHDSIILLKDCLMDKLQFLVATLKKKNKISLTWILLGFQISRYLLTFCIQEVEIIINFLVNVKELLSLSLNSCPTLCDPMDCSTPRLPVYHQSQSLLKLMPIESVMPSNHLILCHQLLLLPSIFPSIRVFSNESALCIRWPKYWSFSFSISPSNEYSGLISFRMDWLDLLAFINSAKGFQEHLCMYPIMILIACFCLSD